MRFFYTVTILLISFQAQAINYSPLAPLAPIFSSADINNNYLTFKSDGKVDFDATEYIKDKNVFTSINKTKQIFIQSDANDRIESATIYKKIFPNSDINSGTQITFYRDGALRRVTRCESEFYCVTADFQTCKKFKDEFPKDNGETALKMQECKSIFNKLDVVTAELNTEDLQKFKTAGFKISDTIRKNTGANPFWLVTTYSMLTDLCADGVWYPNTKSSTTGTTNTKSETTK